MTNSTKPNAVTAITSPCGSNDTKLSPLDFATAQQEVFDAATSSTERKAIGHFGTPPEIASFMASLCVPIQSDSIRILDPGAGVGTLTAAYCQSLIERGGSMRVFIEAWENDPRLVPLLEETLRHCKRSLKSAGHSMTYSVRAEDFVLSRSRECLFDTPSELQFDVAILNPPYFKIRKDSSQARAVQHVVHGQPNIYTLFMAVATEQLMPGGQLVAITPRSYFSGAYFERFRRWFFERMSVKHIHLFESRSDAFKQDAVLQENVILHATATAAAERITLSESKGKDLVDITTKSAGYDDVVDRHNSSRVIRIPSSGIENKIANFLNSQQQRFRDLDFEVSTGPVVAFRAVEYLRTSRSESTASLLWMHNVRPFITRFPQVSKKPAHIEVTDESRKLLLRASTYVLLKRFTAKEEKRRVVAGIVQASDVYSEWLGLENHLNYIHRKGSSLTRRQALGLAAYLNSKLIDSYFRAVSGNTQVNAAEIRALPVPTLAAIEDIGAILESAEKINDCDTEETVARCIDLPPNIARELRQTTE